MKKIIDGKFKVHEFIEGLESISENEHLTGDEITEIFRLSIDQCFREFCYPGAQNKQNALEMPLITKLSLREKHGTIKFYEAKKIVPTDDDIRDDFFEIDLPSALKIKETAKVGKVINIPCDEELVSDFFNNDKYIKRLAQIFKQKINEKVKQVLLVTFKNQIGSNITGDVVKVENDRYLIDFGRTSSFLTPGQCIDGERFHQGQTGVKVYLVDVRETGKNGAVRLFISRTHEGFLRKLLEETVDEIYNGTVVIKFVARKAGVRSKVVVRSLDPNIDPVGACIGSGSGRTQTVSSQLNGEKIDIIRYEPSLEKQVIEALKPAEIIGIKLPEDGEKDIVVICPVGSKNICVGVGGSNVTLASKIVNKPIVVYEVDDPEARGIKYKLVSDIYNTKAKDTLENYANYDEEEEDIVIERPKDSNKILQNAMSINTSKKEENNESNLEENNESVDEKASEMQSSPTEEKVVQTEPEVEINNTTKEEDATNVAPTPVPAKKVEVKEEEKVVIKGKAKRSLEELEQLLENSNKQQRNKKNFKKKKFGDPKVVKADTEKTPTYSENLPIYNDDEEYDDEEYEDEEFDYSEEDEAYDELYSED